MGLVVFDVGRTLVTVKDVVRRDGNQMRADLASRQRHILRAAFVHREAGFDVSLRAIDRGVGGEVNDDVGSYEGHRLDHRVTVGDVQFMTGESYDVELTLSDRDVGLKRRVCAQGCRAREHVEKIYADLSTSAGNEHPGRSAHVRSLSWARTCTTSPTPKVTTSPSTST